MRREAEGRTFAGGLLIALLSAAFLAASFVGPSDERIVTFFSALAFCLGGVIATGYRTWLGHEGTMPAQRTAVLLWLYTLLLAACNVLSFFSMGPYLLPLTLLALITAVRASLGGLHRNSRA